MTDYQQPGGRRPLRPVRFENVRLDDNFWSPWLKRIRAVSLPHLVETSGPLLRDFEYLAGVHQVEGAYTPSTRCVSLVDASRREEYLRGLTETVAACKKMGCHVIMSQVGDELEGVSRQEQIESMTTGLKEAAKILEGTGLVLAIEPLNLTVDHAGYFLARSDEAAEIIKAVASDSVRMLYDIYHQQITEGNLIPNIKKYAPTIAHYHLADHPGRHEPGTGEINYKNVLKALEETGCQGYVGLEFVPEKSTVNSAILKRIRDEYGH